MSHAIQLRDRCWNLT